jgi:hypothetical protein
VCGVKAKLRKLLTLFRVLLRKANCRRVVKGTVFLDLERNPYGRYLYCLVKMLDLSGWHVFLPRRVSLVRDLLSDKYAALILEDGLVSFGRPVGCRSANTKILEDRQIDLDYFAFLRRDGRGERPRKLIPMPQHPTMYRSGVYDEEIKDATRCNAAFFAGNLDFDEYRKFEGVSIFPMMSRVGIISALTTPVAYPNNLQQLQAWIEQRTKEMACVIVDSRSFSIPFGELRSTLSRFDFFLALPGVYMPFSHNVVEALSVGTIPVIEKFYAELFSPPLREGIECVVFHGEHDLNAALERAFRLTESERGGLRAGVREYYETHMTPEAVTRLLLGLKTEEIICLHGPGGASVRRYFLVKPD